ncbi:MAG TPA: hypothetical protein HPP87_09890 [Planctomycetes bacterium]|nr:hypothetical protein [Planctomycetota bacterium]HIJ71658.1 hypothetical protein [Planctomycetota bacterium]
MCGGLRFFGEPVLERSEGLRMTKAAPQNDPASNAGLNELDAGFLLRTRLRRTGKSGMTIVCVRDDGAQC